MSATWCFGASGKHFRLTYRKTIYEEPIELNIEVDEAEVSLKQCIVEIISQQDYFLFVTEDGKLYSMGSSDIGMLALGNSLRTTSNFAKEVYS